MNRSGAFSVRWLVQTSLVAQRLVAFNDNDFKAHQAISIPTEHEAISSCSAKGATAIAAICEATIMYLL